MYLGPYLHLKRFFSDKIGSLLKSPGFLAFFKFVGVFCQNSPIYGQKPFFISYICCKYQNTHVNWSLYVPHGPYIALDGS